MIGKGYKKSQIKQTIARKYYGHLRALPAKPEGDRPTLADLEGEIMCPVCDTTLDQSSSPAARQIKAVISARIAAGDSKQEIKDLLVAQYGPKILAAPPKKGFDLLAWLLPIPLLLGVAILLVALASLPFILGFTVVFVVLGIAAAAIGGILPSDRQLELAGLILVVIGLTFIGLLPWPERLLAPGLLTGARQRNSSILLGAAF